MSKTLEAILSFGLVLILDQYKTKDLIKVIVTDKNTRNKLHLNTQSSETDCPFYFVMFYV